jgi:hypothetical protein
MTVRVEEGVKCGEVWIVGTRVRGRQARCGDEEEGEEE